MIFHSPSFSQLEMTKKGKWVKLIPSLAGGLYRFDGEVVEAVPLDAETLLRSSFKFDNMVMTGGKESRTYGVDMDTGHIRDHLVFQPFLPRRYNLRDFMFPDLKQ